MKYEAWEKDDIVKILQVHPENEWRLGFARNECFIFPVSLHYLISNGWRKIQEDGAIE